MRRNKHTMMSGRVWYSYSGDTKEEWDWIENNFPGGPDVDGTDDLEAYAKYEKKIYAKFNVVDDFIESTETDEERKARREHEKEIEEEFRKKKEAGFYDDYPNPDDYGCFEDFLHAWGRHEAQAQK